MVEFDENAIQVAKGKQITNLIIKNNIKKIKRALKKTKIRSIPFLSWWVEYENITKKYEVTRISIVSTVVGCLLFSHPMYHINICFRKNYILMMPFILLKLNLIDYLEKFQIGL